MRHHESVCRWLAEITILVCCTVGEPFAWAGEKPLPAPPLRLDVEGWSRSQGDVTGEHQSAALSLFFPRRFGGRAPSDGFHLDVAPLFEDFVSFVREAGIPLRAVRDQRNEHRIGVSASFSLGENLPALSFHAGRSVPDLFGAFSTARSFSWGVIWPVRQFTLRVEGGSHSEFGYFAIAGAQWSAPSQPLALGIGVPFALQNANGRTGVLIQFRVRFP